MSQVEIELLIVETKRKAIEKRKLKYDQLQAERREEQRLKALAEFRAARAAAEKSRQ